MPRSEEKDPSANISRLAKSHPEFGQKQRIAVGLSEARRAGGDVPPAPKKRPSRIPRAIKNHPGYK